MAAGSYVCEAIVELTSIERRSELYLHYRDIVNYIQRDTGLSMTSNKQAYKAIKKVDWDDAIVKLKDVYGIRVQKVNDRLANGKFDEEGKSHRTRRVRFLETAATEDGNKFGCYLIKYSGDVDFDAEWVRSCFPVTGHPAVGLVVVRPNIPSRFVYTKVRRRERDVLVRSVNTKTLKQDCLQTGSLPVTMFPPAE